MDSSWGDSESADSDVLVEGSELPEADGPEFADPPLDTGPLVEDSADAQVESPDLVDDDPLVDDTATDAEQPEAPVDDGPLVEDAAAEPSEAAREAIESGVDVAGGKAFFEPDDTTYDTTNEAFPEIPGERKYVVHGCEDGVWMPGQDQPMDAEQFADVVRADAGWENEPVDLYSCDTAKPRADGGTFAQDLADDLGVPVTAPTGIVWLPEGSEPFVASECQCNGQTHPNEAGFSHPVDEPDGEYKTFVPRPK
jgi:hypothetical protein